MTQLTSEPTLIREGLTHLAPSEPRSKGIHISDLINTMAVRLGHYEESEVDDNTRARWQMGHAFERAVVRSLAEFYDEAAPTRYQSLGELELDGIYGTPDMYDAGDDAIEEIKLTWMTARRGADDPKFWRYWVQLKSYCRMANTPLARLHVCYVNGDYGTTTSAPIYRVWERRFTTRELVENWATMRSHAARAREDGQR